MLRMGWEASRCLISSIDSPISPATQARQEYLTPITEGETKPEEGTRLALKAEAALVKATPLA